MLKNVVISLVNAILIGIGFYIPDYFAGVFDRANIVAPLIAFGATFITLTFWDKDK